MKKLLILSTLISSIALAETVTTDKTTAMNITARVIEPLKVEVLEHIKLGTIIKGNKASAIGKYKVTGEAGENYTVTIPELNKEKSGVITLVHEKLATATFPAKVINQDNKMSLIEGGNEHQISVETIVPPGMASGNYSSQLTLSVRYDG